MKKDIQRIVLWNETTTLNYLKSEVKKMKNLLEINWFPEQSGFDLDYKYWFNTYFYTNFYNALTHYTLKNKDGKGFRWPKRILEEAAKKNRE